MLLNELPSGQGRIRLLLGQSLKPIPNQLKKIIQRFDYQFKALAALVDDNHMEQASVDQAEAMLKALETMRANLDKFEGHRF